MRPALPIIIVVALTALSGCALFRGKAPPAPVVATAPPPPVPSRPAPPIGFGRGFTTPRDALGGYVTPNGGIGEAERLWHARAALNVAALACPESDMAPAYNAMLDRLKAPLAKADAEVKALYRSRYGAAWQAEHDEAMTRLYNWFSQPFATAALCTAAVAPLTEVQTLDPSTARTFAARTLPALEAAVVDGYRRWDAYQVADAAWRSRYEAPMAMLKIGPVASR